MESSPTQSQSERVQKGAGSNFFSSGCDLPKSQATEMLSRSHVLSRLPTHVTGLICCHLFMSYFKSIPSRQV